MDSKRLKAISVSPDFFVSIAVVGRSHTAECIKGLPEDVKIEYAYHDILRDCFVVVVSHDTFDEVGVTDRIPELGIHFHITQAAE